MIELLGLLVSIVALGIIALQDFKRRSYYVILLPFLIAGIILFLLVSDSLDYNAILFNASFVLLNLIVLQLYYYFRISKKGLFLDKAMGLGDVLLFFVPALLLDPYLFVGFFVLSSSLGLVFSLIYKDSAKESGIPLAGIMAVVFGGYLSFLMVNQVWM